MEPPNGTGAPGLTTGRPRWWASGCSYDLFVPFRERKMTVAMATKTAEATSLAALERTSLWSQYMGPPG